MHGGCLLLTTVLYRQYILFCFSLNCHLLFFVAFDHFTAIKECFVVNLFMPLSEQNKFLQTGRVWIFKEKEKTANGVQVQNQHVEFG